MANLLKRLESMSKDAARIENNYNNLKSKLTSELTNAEKDNIELLRNIADVPQAKDEPVFVTYTLLDGKIKQRPEFYIQRNQMSRDVAFVELYKTMSIEDFLNNLSPQDVTKVISNVSHAYKNYNFKEKLVSYL